MNNKLFKLARRQKNQDLKAWREFKFHPRSAKDSQVLVVLDECWSIKTPTFSFLPSLGDCIPLQMWTQHVARLPGLPGSKSEHADVSHASSTTHQACFIGKESIIYIAIIKCKMWPYFSQGEEKIKETCKSSLPPSQSKTYTPILQFVIKSNFNINEQSHSHCTTCN